MSEVDVCPICKGDNRCGNVNVKGDCWCTARTFPEEIFLQIPKEELHKRCICQRCLERITARK